MSPRWPGCSVSPRAGTSVASSSSVGSGTGRCRAPGSRPGDSRRSRGTYGAPRIHAELTEGGVAVSRKRVARHAVRRRRRGEPAPRPSHARRNAQARPAPDRVERRFEADAPNRLWVADTPTSRPWPASCTWPSSSTCSAGASSLGHGGASSHRAGGRGAGDGRGAAPRRSKGCAVHLAGLRHSLPAGALRYRWVPTSTMRWPRASSRPWRRAARPNDAVLTHAEARAALFEFIEGWYNTRRRHSDRSPLEFERLHQAGAVDGARPVDALRAPHKSVGSRAAHGIHTAHRNQC